MKLNKSGLGITIGGVNISAIFFADDIVLFAKNAKDLHKLMKICRSYFKSHMLQISDKKSKIMSYNASTENVVFEEFENNAQLTLEQVLTFKYLGISLSVSPYCMFRKYTEKVKEKAKSYLYSVLSLVRSGPDRSELVRTLWVNFALPSILYGCEIIPIDKKTIQEIEKCQASIGDWDWGLE